MMNAETDAIKPAGKDGLSAPQRLLVIGGLLLIITGMIFGDVFAVFILHPNAARISQALYAAANAVAGQNPDQVFFHFNAIGGFLENRGTKVDTHVHIIKMGYLALLLALIQPYVKLGSRLKLRLAQLFLTGAVLLPPAIFLIHYIGLAYSPLEAIGWASVVADLSGLLVIVACAGELMGLWCYFRGNTGPGQGADMQVNINSRESRILLAGGVLMLLAGFLFGAYYAATRAEVNEAREVSLLQAVIEQASVNDMQAVEQTLGDYGRLQGERAVSIAAHAHINEFGMLALLMAFLQPYVFLTRCWKRRWVVVMLLGSVVLPVFVYLELKFGLVAGGVADTGGLLVILALFAMFCGVLRYTGKADATAGNAL